MFSGLVQLEALEMLSNQCEGKVQHLLASLPPEQLQLLKGELMAIRDAFELEDMDNDDGRKNKTSWHIFKLFTQSC